MRLAALCRMLAYGIAILGVLDPPTIVATRPPVIVDVGIAVADANAREARGVVEALSAALGSAAILRTHPVALGGALPCDAATACLVVADGRVAIDLPADRRSPTSLVMVDLQAAAVRLVEATADPAQRSAEARLRLRLTGRAPGVATSTIRVTDDNAVVGEVVHAWNGASEAEVVVPWWPVADGQRLLAVEVDTNGAIVRATVPARVSAEPSRVLVFEPRPSFATSFVRRAIEADPRLQVDAITRLAASLGTSTGGVRLDDATLERARVVILGAPEAVTGREAELLDRFVRLRGGSLIVVPDQPLSGPLLALVGDGWHSHTALEPARVGPLLASEWLTQGTPLPRQRVLAAAVDGAVIVAVAAGEGRVVVSGAMDAWRHRGVGDGFDRFWRALVADAADAAGDTVRLTASPALVRPGQRVRVHVARRAMQPTSSATAALEILCTTPAGDERMRGSQVIRAWPVDVRGAFDGDARAYGDGPCRITGIVDGARSETTVMVTAAANRPEAESLGPVRAIAARTGGVAVEPGQIDRIVSYLKSQRAEQPTQDSRHPMRSVLWMLPLTSALALEWWLRRSAGLR